MVPAKHIGVDTGYQITNIIKLDLHFTSLHPHIYSWPNSARIKIQSDLYLTPYATKPRKKEKD